MNDRRQDEGGIAVVFLAGCLVVVLATYDAKMKASHPNCLSFSTVSSERQQTTGFLRLRSSSIKSILFRECQRLGPKAAKTLVDSGHHSNLFRDDSSRRR